MMSVKSENGCVIVQSLTALCLVEVRQSLLYFNFFMLV